MSSMIASSCCLVVLANVLLTLLFSGLHMLTPRTTLSSKLLTGSVWMPTLTSKTPRQTASRTARVCSSLHTMRLSTLPRASRSGLPRLAGQWQALHLALLLLLPTTREHTGAMLLAASWAPTPTSGGSPWTMTRPLRMTSPSAW